LKRIQNIQALRGIAVISVVIIHLIMMEQKYGGAQTILSGTLKFRFFGVDLFFIMSGFLMVTITRGKFRDPVQALRFFYGRISRIYPIYWIFTTLVLIVFLVHPGWVNNYQGNQVNILSSFLLIPESTLPLIIVAWTLVHEMYFYIMFTLIIFLFPEKYLRHTIFIWGSIVLVLNLTAGPVNPYIKVISHPLTFEFIAGCFLAYIYHNSDVKISKKILFPGAAASVIVSLAGYYVYQIVTGEIELPSWWRLLIFGFPAFVTVFCMIYAEKDGFKIHNIFYTIGNASYSIYLTHIMTLSAFGRLWSVFASEGIADNFVMLPLTFILVIYAGMMSFKYIERPLLNLSKKML
jgi:exopolysaccharide production protein ExoZ